MCVCVILRYVQIYMRVFGIERRDVLLLCFHTLDKTPLLCLSPPNNHHQQHARFPIHPMRNACGVSRAVDDDDHDIWCGSPLSSRLRPDRSSSLGERNARVDIATVRQSTHTHNTSTMQETVLFTGFDPRLAVSTATLRRQHRIPSDLRS